MEFVSSLRQKLLLLCQLTAPSALFAILSGGLVGQVGYFQPFLVIGGIFATVGAGLLYSLDIDSSAGQYIGYQILVGVGVGTSIQIPVITAQALSDMAEIPCVTAVVLCTFCPFLGPLQPIMLNPPHPSFPTRLRGPLRLRRTIAFLKPPHRVLAVLCTARRREAGPCNRRYRPPEHL